MCVCTCMYVSCMYMYVCMYVCSMYMYVCMYMNVCKYVNRHGVMIIVKMNVIVIAIGHLKTEVIQIVIDSQVIYNVEVVVIVIVLVMY